jgi:5S rRNA maturation endonuclease (ribonuclease M5)
MPTATASTRQRGGDTAPPFTETEIAEARLRIDRAFELGGLIENGQPKCPKCGNVPKKGKFKLRATGGWTHHGCGGSGDNAAISLLAERLGITDLKGREFYEIVGELLGRPLPSAAGKPTRAPIPVDPTAKLAVVETFEAVVDLDVYADVIAAGSVEDAVAYYGRWHISREAVVESKTVMLRDVPALGRELLARYGEERLAACGLILPRDGRRPAYWMLNADYPVIEPHCRPDGSVSGMQFRPSYAREARYGKHVAYCEAKKAATAAGRTFREPAKDEEYIPKFLSLKGGVPGKHLIGCGLHRLAQLEPGTDVCIVEGFKDYLAMRTMGVEAFAIPGTQAMPTDRVCRELARHTMVLCLDADEAGEKATEVLEAHLTSRNVPNRRSRRTFPKGWDVTDYLVSKNVKRGCQCATCQAFAAKHAVTAG